MNVMSCPPSLVDSVRPFISLTSLLDENKMEIKPFIIFLALGRYTEQRSPISIVYRKTMVLVPLPPEEITDYRSYFKTIYWS